MSEVLRELIVDQLVCVRTFLVGTEISNQNTSFFVESEIDPKNIISGTQSQVITSSEAANAIVDRYIQWLPLVLNQAKA